MPEIEQRLNDVLKFGDLTHAYAHVLTSFLQQTRMLARQYDAVVANPPYMGTKAMNQTLKEFARRLYPHNKADLFAFFSERIMGLCSSDGNVGVMTPFVWMFIKSYEHFRDVLLNHKTLSSLIRPEYHAFFESAYVPICAFAVWNRHVANFRGSFIDLTAFYGEQEQPRRTLEAIRNPECKWRYSASSVDFHAIPGCPIAYWASPKIRSVFQNARSIQEIAAPKHGMSSGDNGRFLRRWHEVSIARVMFDANDRDAAAASRMKWFPFNKGGAFRKWYGNNEFVINYESNGRDLIASHECGENPGFRHDNPHLFFRTGITWSAISSSDLACRRQPKGTIFSNAGMAIFGDDAVLLQIEAVLNSAVGKYCLGIMCPTMNYGAGEIGKVPFLDGAISVESIRRLEESAEHDWNCGETSAGFISCPLLLAKAAKVRESLTQWHDAYQLLIEETKRLEEENNRLLIARYGLDGELSVQLDDEKITLYRPEPEEDTRRLISYAIGCMMGRYSLDGPGLIYAHSGNAGFDPSQYKTFRADDDGIIPLLETDWGIRDDAANRLVEFIGVAWPKEHLQENLKFVADSLGPNNGEQPRETIRRYLATGFYKHHLSMYKKRPIYWLFSSGKQRAFQCLVYLHRYHEGTLARMRTEYVIPLQGQIAARIEQLEGDKAKATSTSHRRKLQKEQDDLKKQQAELAAFEEKLKHAADQKISLDLDDGVKVNYAKFGDLLAESKAITGGKDEE